MKEFDLNGTIVSNDDSFAYDFFELDNTSPSEVKSFLTQANGEDIQININSGGGDLYAGVNIHDLIKGYKGNVEIHICGLAASAASIVAMAGKCLMSPASMFMIHNTACRDYGNKRDKAKCAIDLGVHDKGVAALYAMKTGIDLAEIMRMMDKETWFDAQTALEQGFIDGILTNEVNAPRILNSIGDVLLPQNVIDKIRQLKQTDKLTAKTNDGVPVEQLRKRLSLLRR